MIVVRPFFEGKWAIGVDISRVSPGSSARFNRPLGRRTGKDQAVYAQCVGNFFGRFHLKGKIVYGANLEVFGSTTLATVELVTAIDHGGQHVTTCGSSCRIERACP